MRKSYFEVGDFVFSVCLPAVYNVDELLPNFRPFKLDKPADGLFACEVLSYSEIPAIRPGELLDSSTNDMGLVNLYACPSGYWIEIAAVNGGMRHCMLLNPDVPEVKAFVHWEDARVGFVLSSLLRIAYSQTVLKSAAVSVHASVVFRDGHAYLFMGKSGTGKSTHAALWRKFIPGTDLLNDDNPVLRVTDTGVRVYGTPWSGKTPCYKKLSFPVQGIVRLAQAPFNRFTRCKGAEAFVQLLPGCSVIRKNTDLSNGLYDTLAKVSSRVLIGRLECLPDEEAARLCWTALNRG